ncbi:MULTISPECIES: hypothetical protein [unclassified Streptomyces]|uniref:hypothetical protein n=1 Tax=unclassified Streptomyces TaxID=2593676 RepID=UPI0038004044
MKLHHIAVVSLATASLLAGGTTVAWAGTDAPATRPVQVDHDLPDPLACAVSTTAGTATAAAVTACATT